jgi:Mrp family chromosome partitioning ATPase
LKTLLDTYQIIIVDLPAVRPGYDALAMGAALDGVIVVAEWGKTPLPALTEAAHALRTAHAKLIGAVMTKVDGRDGDAKTSRRA